MTLKIIKIAKHLKHNFQETFVFNIINFKSEIRTIIIDGPISIKNLNSECDVKETYSK